MFTSASDVYKGKVFCFILGAKLLYEEFIPELSSINLDDAIMPVAGKDPQTYFQLVCHLNSGPQMQSLREEERIPDFSVALGKEASQRGCTD